MNGLATHAWKRLKHVTAIKGGAGFPHEEQGLLSEELPFYKVGDLERAALGGTLSEPEHTVSRDTAKRLGAHVFRPGSVVFAKVGAALLLNRFRQLPGEACLDNNMMGLEPLPNAVTQRFLKYAMETKDLSVIANPGAVPSVNGSQIAEERIWCPHILEQERIANVLDEQMARIDALIAEKEALHTLLEEEKQACIDRAAFGGLEPPQSFPFVPDSRVLDGAPWSRCMLKHKWHVTDCKHLTVEFLEEGFPIASIREVSTGTLRLQNAKRATEEAYRNLIEGDRQPKRGDLIYARNASVGAVALVDTDEPFSMGQDVCLITSQGQDQSFLRLQLMSSPLKAQLESLLQGATIRRINVEQIRSFSVFVPPVSVQREVVERAVDELRRRQHLQSHIREHIQRLLEYRSALISAAVTGQVDVGAPGAPLRLAA